jgi:hypothetical protein
MPNTVSIPIPVAGRIPRPPLLTMAFIGAVVAAPITIMMMVFVFLFATCSDE